MNRQEALAKALAFNEANNPGVDAMNAQIKAEARSKRHPFHNYVLDNDLFKFGNGLQITIPLDKMDQYKTEIEYMTAQGWGFPFADQFGISFSWNGE